MNRSLLWPSARVFVRTGRTGAGPEADRLVSLKPAGQLCALMSVVPRSSLGSGNLPSANKAG